MPENLSQKWEKAHREQILSELKTAGIELTKENIPKIINETSFKIRSRKYPDKCPYYQMSPPRPCHDIEDLNCFLCACPNYESDNLKGGCKINSKYGKWYYHQNLPKGVVWDCSDCKINHSTKEVKRYLEKHTDKFGRIKI